MSLLQINFEPLPQLVTEFPHCGIVTFINNIYDLKDQSTSSTNVHMSKKSKLFKNALIAMQSQYILA